MHCTNQETKHEVPDKKFTKRQHRIITIPVDVHLATQVTLWKVRAVHSWLLAVLCGAAVVMLALTARSHNTEIALVKDKMVDLVEELQLTRLELLRMQKDIELLQERVKQLEHGHHSKVKREVLVQSSSDAENISSPAIKSPDGNNSDCSLCSLGSRTKRSARRGNHSGWGKPSRRKNPRHKDRTRGLLAVHFKGGLPERVIEDSGLVAPWFPDKSAVNEFSLNNYTMREGKGTVEITECGLYWIYAQVYYLTSEHQNSFSINLRKAGEPLRTLATCSANSGTVKSTSEISCYTSVVRYLNIGDRIFVHQRERNRRVILRDSFSFLGLVRLNSLQGGRC